MVGLIVSLSLLLHVAEGAPAGAARLENLAFISGEWTTAPDGPMVSQEHWTQPRAGTMMATARTMRGDKTVFFEFLRIEQRPAGIVYIAQPRGGPPTEFTLTSLAGKTAVFENPKHDFPQKITYQQIDENTLRASIEGPRNGTTAREQWDFQRISPQR